MDPPVQGGPPRGRKAGGDAGSRRRRASRRTTFREQLGGLGSGGFRSRLRRWVAPHGLGESNGGAGRAGEAQLTTHGTGVWRRANRPETRKKASPHRLPAKGALGGWLEVAWGLGGARGPFYSG